jgi:sn-glycerol 3-phosphate transport system ATP-binding protein
VVEQIGTPEVVYLQPRTTFVAGFIGSPPMNLLPVKVVNGTVRLDGLELPLIHPAPRDGELVLGVRPEHAFFAGEGWPVQVEVVEMLGAERLVHTRVGQQTFIVRMDAGVTPAMPGQILNVQTVPGHVHWFDPQTRQRIDS